MLKDVTAVEPLEDFKLRLKFDDGAEGVVDIAALVEFRGVFAPLRDPLEFRKVRVNPDLGTITWSNGADIDPDVLYSVATGQPIDFALQRV